MMRFLSACCALQLVACSHPSPTLYVPPELAPISRLAVTGREDWISGTKPLHFGEYTLARRGSFGFRLTATGRGSWVGDCAPITTERQGPPPIVVASDLRCTLDPGGGDTSRTWRLVVRTLKGEVPRGDLVGPNARVDVLGANQVQGGSAPGGALPAGYHILAAGRAVAAVDPLGEGAVWLDTGLAAERRDAIAAAAAALLLWNDLVNPRK